MAHTQTHSATPGSRNRNTAVVLAGVVAGMIALAFAAVPLYQVFCQVTGYGGTTQRASADSLKGTIAREMTTRFDATVPARLPIRVEPSAPVTNKIGASRTIEFTATNMTAREIATTASFNVTPDKAGLYFNKIECFCFTQQTLAPGETAKMPVTFFIDPDIDEDADLDTIKEITLSYTFYASENGGS